MGANKNSIKIIGDHTDKYVQAYFQYDSKKTGGVTISHLRFGDKPIKVSVLYQQGRLRGLPQPLLHHQGLQDGGPGRQARRRVHDQLPVDDEELNHHLDAAAKRYIAKNNIQLYTINAIDLAIEIGMGKRTNTILQSAFLLLAKVMPEEEAIRYMKEKAKASHLPEEGPGRGGYEPTRPSTWAPPPIRRSTCPPTGPTPWTSRSPSGS